MCNGVVANMANMGRKGLHVAVVPTLLLVMNRGRGRKETTLREAEKEEEAP